MENFSNIKNIIFDLGGVLFGLNPAKTIEAFELAGINDITGKYKKLVESNLFLDFEKGLISIPEFRNGMNALCNSNLDEKTFRNCWNSMITDYNPINNRLLRNIKKDFNIFVLSNTNQIHTEYFLPIADWPDNLFNGIYFSNEIHLRKPDADCFNFVINNAELNKDKTLFIDDRQDNITGAQNVGLKTLRLESQELLYKIFENYL